MTGNSNLFKAAVKDTKELLLRITNKSDCATIRISQKSDAIR